MQELSLNILDIAENSVRAEAGLVRITVEVIPAEGKLVLTVEDDGKGMDGDTAKGATDPFSTTRTTRKVGLGLPYLKMNAEMTGGAVEIESKAGEGTKVTAVFAIGHIDRVPLGDMGQTMSLLAGANPEMDFVYELRARDEGGDHQPHGSDNRGIVSSGASVRDAESFIFNTKKIKKTLEGVPISEPEVMRYIASYIDEGTKGLIAKYGL